MKKVLLTVGILSFVACVIFLFFAGLYMFGYYHVVDGTTGLYNRLHQKMIIYCAVGIVTAVIGAMCFIIRSK